MHICNNKRPMTDFEENFTIIPRSTLDCIFPRRRRDKIRLVLKDNTERLVLTLTNVLYFSYSPSNLVRLGLLNNAGIFHHNKDQTLYDQETQKTFALAKHYNTSFFLYPPNLLIASVSLLKNNNIYINEKPNIHQT